MNLSRLTTRLSAAFAALVAFYAGIVVATGDPYGLEPANLQATLTCAVDWLDAHTLHTESGAPDGWGGYLVATAIPGLPAAVADQIKGLRKNLDEIMGEGGLEDQIREARDAAHDAKTEVEKRSLDNAEFLDELKSKVFDIRLEEFKTFTDELHELLDEREIELIEKMGGSKASRDKRFGDDVVKSVEEKGYTSPGHGDKCFVNLDGYGIKDITSVTGSGGALVDEDYREQILGIQLRQPRILDLLTVLETDSNAVEYVVQDTETDNVGAQDGEGTDLGKTDFTFDLKTAVVRTLGTYAKASIQILDDAARLRTWTETRLRQLLDLEIEDQLLYGDDTGGKLDGLVPNSTAYDSSLETALGLSTVTDIDRIRVAVLQLQRNNFPATGIILPPFNWANIELTKDNDDRYIFARPQDSAVPRMWGLPVVSTNALNEGTGHVGNYQVGPSVYDRMMSAVEMSTENDTDFQSLMVTFRIYARLTLAIEYPKALIDLDDLTDGPSGGS